MFLYRIYQIFIMLPILAAATILCATVTILGCALGGEKWWGFRPASMWGRLWCVLAGVKVDVSGRDNIDPGTSYVFVANHQGAYDIFSIYGYLRHNFRWMMKQSLRRIPFVGFSCKVSGQVFVDNSSPSAIRRTMHAAEKQLAKGRSVVVFPEGSRTPDGRLHAFKRGAYTLAVEFGLPVVPVTIDGAYRVMPRTAWLPRPGRITLTIHKPIQAGADGHDLRPLMEASREAIASALPENER